MPEGITIEVSEKYGGGDYIQRSAAGKAKIMVEMKIRLRTLDAQIKGHAQEFERVYVETINDIQECGLILQSACGHETMSFTFWQSNFEGQVPFDFDCAKMRMSVAAKINKKAQRMRDAGEFLHPMLITEDILESPVRKMLQHANPIPPLHQFFDKFASFRQDLKKIGSLDKEVAEKCLVETQWMEDERAKWKAVVKA